MINNTYKINSHVCIVALGADGRVLEILVDRLGIQYDIRYFWEGTAQSAWFYEDELTEPKDG